MKSFSIIQKIYWRYFKSPEEFARHLGVKIGKGCFISTRNFPSEGFFVEIGDYVRLANNVCLYTHGGVWALRKAFNNPKLDYFGKIKIGSYTHVGEDAKIMPGVTIGSRCVIGAGTVVTKSVPDGCMVAGNPCKFIGYTEDFYNRSLTKNIETGQMSHNRKVAYLKSLSDTSFIVKKQITIPQNKNGK